MTSIRKIIAILSCFLGLLLSKDFAYSLDEGSRQMGIFHPVIYGMKNDIEFTTHPILFIIKPNFKIKK